MYADILFLTVSTCQSIQDGFRAGSNGPSSATRRVTSYKEFCMKRGIVDNMRLPSRPYRFEFESNEDEERAIAEAIAREEELMRQEEESKREQRGENNWQHPRIIDRFGQVGTNLFNQLSKQPLTYSSNLMPTKEDTSDQKCIKQMLDSLITQVCRWDKQFGWYKSHLKRPRNRVELDKLRSRRMFSNQREVMLAEHVDRLRKEINKRRTRLENAAEEQCGMLTPWRKARGRPNRDNRRASAPKNRQVATPEPERRRKVVNPAEISLGGDSMDWGGKEEEMKTDGGEGVKEENEGDAREGDHLIEDHSLSPTRARRRMMNVGGATETLTAAEWNANAKRKQAAPSKADRLRRVKLSCQAEGPSSGDEQSSRGDGGPRKRGRPRKEREQNETERDSDTGGPVEHPVPAGMDPEALHCVCQKPYNPYKFYIACDMCCAWFHGKCVGVCESEARQLSGWACPGCDQQAGGGGGVDDMGGHGGMTNQPNADQVYCICRKPYDDTQFYVGCDGCEGWFHPACVNITQQAAEAMAEYLCPGCSEAEEGAEPGDVIEEEEMDDEEGGYESAGSAESRQSVQEAALSRADYPLVWRLLDLISDHRMAWPFREPPSEEQMEAYCRVVNDHIDLGIIQKRLENLEYLHLRDFGNDMRKMFENARGFYPKESPVQICADTLEKIFEQHLAEAKSEMEGRRTNDRRKASECRTIDSSLDIDTDQLMDVNLDVDFEQLI